MSLIPLARTRPGLASRLLLLASAIAAANCGARSSLKIFAEAGADAAPVLCEQDGDCAGDLCAPADCREGICVALPKVDCDDSNPCTTDACDPANGMCRHDFVTLDQDGDGYRAPLPGKTPGAPDACGNDCDDTHASAHPNAQEVCDGVDNDCDGIIDNNRGFGAPAAGPVLVQANSEPGGLASNGQEYIAAYRASRNDTDLVSVSDLDSNGNIVSASDVTSTLAGANGGPLLWTGNRYGLAWSDRRDSPGNNLEYEIYFNLLEQGGKKLGPDLRVTNARGFSGYPVLAWTGGEYIVVWEDDRVAGPMRTPGSPGAPSGGGDDRSYHVFGQRITVDGALDGDNVLLSPVAPGGDEAPSVAAGKTEIGVTWARSDGTHSRIMFALFGFDLRPIGTPLELTTPSTEGRYPIVIFNGSRYVVSWFYGSSNPNHQLFASSLDESGKVVVPTRAIADGTVDPRTPAMLGLGDRIFLSWADARDDNDGFELYSQVLDASLNSVAKPQRLTFAAGDSTAPVMAFGANGDVGILFSDDRLARHDSYFLRLPCTAGNAP